MPVFSLEDLRSEVGGILDGKVLRNMGHSPYDTAWVARVAAAGAREPLFPEALAWVRRSQCEDGGWAPEVEYVSARILATLSCILAVVEFDGGPEARRMAEAGAHFVLRNWPRLETTDLLTNGFEVIACALIEEACAAGLPLADLRPHAAELRRTKLSRLPPSMLYSPERAMGYTFEFLYDDLDAERARDLQLSDGSIGASVASTAYYARRTGDVRARDYLRQVVEDQGIHNIPFGWPAVLFTLIWALRSLHMAGLMTREMVLPHLEFIDRRRTKYGLCWAPELQYGDSDDTAEGFALLYDFGFPVDWRTLQAYEADDCFKSVLGENSVGVSTNANILASIRGRNYPGFERAERKISELLISTQDEGGYWMDKWHASPYYGTSCAVRALGEAYRDKVGRGVKWILETQRPDGSWGAYRRGTPEETAYALQTLALWRDRGNEVETSSVSRALGYLASDAARTGSLPLWTGKCLYDPEAIVRATVLSARALWRDVG